MRTIKVWLSSATLVAVLSGTAVLLGTCESQAQLARDEHRAEQSYWRHHDGRWIHWDPRDKRWYYTDGSHWFYHDNELTR